jgi:hypothetical protein
MIQSLHDVPVRPVMEHMLPALAHMTLAASPSLPSTVSSHSVSHIERLVQSLVSYLLWPNAFCGTTSQAKTPNPRGAWALLSRTRHMHTESLVWYLVYGMTHDLSLSFEFEVQQHEAKLQRAYTALLPKIIICHMSWCWRGCHMLLIFHNTHVVCSKASKCTAIGAH